MDTLTHALSGALLARASAPRQARIPIAARIGAGFFASAFPDVDWVLSYVSPVAYLTQHRGVTHSLFLMPLWALMLAWSFARIDRSKQTSWRDYLAVCMLALGIHITGDLITSFGTMIYAPFSNERVAWSTTFIIDLWFTGIIVAGLAASLIWRRSRVPATLALTVLAGYVGMQALARERALDFGERYAEARGFRDARVSAIPRPVSPFNWVVMVSGSDRYHYANVNLVRKTVPATPDPEAGLLSRLDAAYVPLDAVQWTTLHKYGTAASERELAVRALAHPALGFFRWFADYPALYRIDRGNPTTCVWFEDLRFAIPGRDSNLFRYGLCDEHDEWRAFTLLADGTRKPADR